MHPRNRHQGHYPIEKLTSTSPELTPYIIKNKLGEDSVDFANANAVRALNRALLKYYYGLQYWAIEEGFLCPPIPGRADAIHIVADLMADHNNGQIPRGPQIKGLDIGVGANCIYPIIGKCEYDWSFKGVDINSASLKNAQKIVDQNEKLKDAIVLEHQPEPEHIFKNIIKPTDQYDFSICNPPFHSSLEEAQSGTRRKWKNLGKLKEGKTSISSTHLNFGGKDSEIWCEGGEKEFILSMIQESSLYKKQVRWFTTLVSNESFLPLFEKKLVQLKVTQLEALPLSQGQKKSRIIAWSFIV